MIELPELRQKVERGVMAHKPGLVSYGYVIDALDKYVEAAILAERERCAKICDQQRQTFLAGAAQSREEGEYGEGQWAEWNAQGAHACASAIRNP